MGIEQITETNPLQKAMNHDLMVAFINRRLPNSAHLDVRKSFVYYDVDKCFVVATSIEVGGPGGEYVFEQLGIKYWSIGIV